MTHIDVAIATQEAMINGWIFAVYETATKRTITTAINPDKDKAFEFESDTDFLEWLMKEEKQLRMSSLNK
ncbi:hypothetical protein HNV23_08800 [Bacillus paranthracis]|uniref:hypothetical protein n=1 Tax=Bacillus paranthracis TaxID=2026186 RepID=UPI00148F3077|nr:hypothetical protein [Bacillus paranthracis]NOP79584.1 hypothetical protein [Bacillus paranthracis]